MCCQSKVSGIHLPLSPLKHEHLDMYTSEVLSQEAFLAIIVSLGTLVYFTFQRGAQWRARSRGCPLPPGPRGLPLIGNIYEMRQPDLWQAHRTLSETYGEFPSDSL